MFLIYILQIFLVPYQSINYFARQTDKTRLRFLVLTLAYFVFSVTWLSCLQTLSFATWKEIPSIGYIGVLMIGYTYYYLSKESEMTESTNRSLVLVVLLSITYLLQHLATLHFSSNTIFYVTIVSFALTQIIAVVYGVRLVRLIIRAKIVRGSISPINLATLIVFFIYVFSPLFFGVISNASIEFVIINAPFIVISFAYLSHDVKQQKSEGELLHPKLSSDTLNDRYEKIEKGTWIIAEYSELNRSERNEKIAELLAEYELTDKQKEIAIMIINGSTTVEIAKRINRSEATVRWHIMHLSEKVGVSGIREFREKFHEMYYSQKKVKAQ